MSITVSGTVLLRLVLVFLQALAAAFFVTDMIAEILRDGFVVHNALETAATLALVGGVIVGAVELRSVLRRVDAADASLMEAKAAFSARVYRRFDEWALTPAEREIALLMLKGFETPEIADLRKTAQGTVRAQVSRIYEKSRKSGRGQFAATFIDVLIEHPVASGQV